MWLLLIAACLHAPPPAPQCALAEDTVIRAEDGAPLALHHHAGSGPPVLVVHGLSSNHHCWDLAPGRSLAVALVEAGFDAWLLDLRGHGDSALARPRAKPGWTVDDYGQKDLKAAIDYVRAQTGYARVGYVGHSMGGMVLAIYQATWGDDALAGVVIVGSPVDFGDPDALLTWSRRGFALGALISRVDSQAFSKMAAPLGADQPFHIDDLLFDAENLSEPGRSQMFERVVSPLYRNEQRQFETILRARRFVSADGAVDYASALSRLHAPLLVIAGRADHIAPPDRVRPYYERAGSAERRYVLAGKENGFQADYGHLDLTVGDHADQEIFPLITGWLSGRFTEADRPR